MATLSPTKAPLITAAIAASGRNPAKIETAIWKARADIKYLAGQKLSNADIAKMADAIAEYIAAMQPWNCSIQSLNTMLLQAGYASSEYVVQKLLNEIIEGGIRFIADAKAEGNEI